MLQCEKLTKLTKITPNIKFMRTCQKEYLVPTFANTIRHRSKKLKAKISRFILETELQSKYEQKKKIRKKIR